MSNFLDIFSGIKHDDVSVTTAPSGVELMYRQSEQVFGSVAQPLVNMGWSIYPQDEERRPGRVNGSAISWQSDHKLSEKLPTQKALESWSRACSTLNVACVMGEGSGNAFALDVDVLDPEISDEIVLLAEEMLGETPLIRVGRAPKVALFYRCAENEQIYSLARHFSEKDALGESVPSENAIEILSKGKSITFMGKHHKTGRYFQWLKQSPLNVSPSELPEVTASKLSEFMEAIEERIQPFHRGSSVLVQVDDVEWDDTTEVRIPRLKAVQGAPWIEDKNGKVIDGREAYLTSLVYRFAEANRTVPPEKLIMMISEQFINTANATGRWSPNRIQNEVRSRLTRLLQKVKSGETVFHDVSKVKGQGAHTATDTFRLKHSKKKLKERGLDFLPCDTEKRTPIKGVLHEGGDPVVLTDEERQRQIDGVQTGLRDALDEFFEDVFYANCGKNPENVKIHLIKAPTGAGKTSQTLRYIGEKRAEHEARANQFRYEGHLGENGEHIQPAQGLDRTYMDESGNEREGNFPIVFLMPTYSNIEEVRVRAEVLNLDGSLGDEELKRAAVERGIIAEEDIEARLADLKRDAMDAGLHSMVYRGKIAAGCQMAEKIQAAMEGGISTSGFCKATVKNEYDEPEEILCPHYNNCEAIRQRDIIQQHDLIFTPHPFMHLNIPEPLTHVRAVIADERIHHLFLHTAEFPLYNLALPRKAVRLTKKERDNGVSELDLAQAREMAVEIVTDAFLQNECPAHALYNYASGTSLDEENNVTGFKLAQDALRVCSSAIQKDANITPNMSLEEVKELSAQPTGKFVREEARFWKILIERMDSLRDYSLAENAIKKLEADIEVFTRNGDFQHVMDLRKQLDNIKKVYVQPKGKKDYRIQYVQEHVGKEDVRALIRISWRSVPNWANVPLLLLDASAAPPIINKIWLGATVKTHDIMGPLNMRVVGVVNRTFSNASIVGSLSDSETQKVQNAQSLRKVRQALATVSSWFGWSRVVAGTSILLRRTINTDWAGPTNVDWCHYGAMRGLDFAKHHAAAFSVGRMELPIRTIDGLVAALTYDDEDPEDPYDIDGTGLTPEGHPLLMPSEDQVLKLRSGEVVELPTPMHPGKWGRLIQKQYREEELLQFVGRLRPVYREGEPPVWFALSSVIPQELVIDDLIHIDDLITPDSRFWEAVRRTDGIVHSKLLYEVGPELFANEREVQILMNKFGFRSSGRDTDNRCSRGFVGYRLNVSNGDDQFAYIRSEFEDPANVILDYMSKTSIQVTSVTPMEQKAFPTLARPRVNDSVEDDLGDRPFRLLSEKENAQRASMHILIEGLKRSDEGTKRGVKKFPLSFSAAVEGNMKNVRMTFQDAECRMTLKKVWDAKKAELTSTIISDISDSYDNLGNTISDADN